MSRYARHLDRQGPTNPFPGLKALERRLGRRIPHRLGSNEGLDMPHRALTARFGAEFAELARAYGDAEAFGVRQRLSDALGTPLESLLVDAGADSLIALALRATCEPDSPVIASAGTYPTFGYFAAGQGCRMSEVAYRDAPGLLAPDLQALAERAHRENARLVYLANPDNPGGHLHDDDAVLALREALPEACTLLLDEAYHDFRRDAEAPAAGAVWPGVIRLRTFSKAHGLAGLRIGYAIAEPEALTMLTKVRIHYAVSSLALAAAETVLDHPDETRDHVGAVVACRERLAERLRGLGGDVPPSDTNFIAVRLADADRAARIHRQLLDAGTLVHRPAHPALGHVLRISTLADALAPGRLDALIAGLDG
ncbi:aminotransferase class I/II-fold pyridoxal phosphate-dependent enzyme [Halomonas sp. HP20-15]|uniref:aminotransferase class I/II-fold pyridoxal phosphate-dependent enzyme n=1 Tax=Halomonas sp. HP20-15 TaxID=3085901 RepID=UPI002981097F|nr:aminotransferase class I/II-fold pyridoxal phosphate-dependent enzyme [Halomonas sp. HP20-15]MDW5376069.1 aminotransferase class I/II-fold pyridoxal phosphate-dependent enzyme [Halomonas sp. HP20-15]